MSVLGVENLQLGAARHDALTEILLYRLDGAPLGRVVRVDDGNVLRVPGRDAPIRADHSVIFVTDAANLVTAEVAVLDAE